MIKAVVRQDDLPWNPREWDNLGQMVCFHRRYSLGDKHTYRVEDFSSWDELAERIRQEHQPLLLLPLYLYDHSCRVLDVRINPYWVHAAWDAGQVGFIFATRQRLEALGVPEDDVENQLINEVKEYSAYLNGDIWLFQILGEDDDVLETEGDFYDQDACYQAAQERLKKYEKEAACGS